MNIRQGVGVVTATLVIIAFMTLLNYGSPTPMVNWPVETYMGLTFTIGWFSGVPNWLAYVLAAVVLILIVVGFYKIGSWIYVLIADKL
ncbi:hypothetical protein IPZ60_12715 [Psychrobacter sp. NG25]|uniref:hypothetical protein n=1 Tax=Psychrobacter sp. NG25 TaxID=2782005 RepID=UPI0018838593|nr:hypothetical protein [Psychrobacter sp. NG25]MBF0659605.1 hypothetical protein [Psychrobacter sp. NG25]